MSPSLPRITAREVLGDRVMRGFVLSRPCGSHKTYKNQPGRRVTIPFHTREILHPKVLKGILADAEWGVGEFTQMLRET